MKKFTNLNKNIFRNRLILEGFYNNEIIITEELVLNFLQNLTKYINYEALSDVVLFSPNNCSNLHHGIGGFIPWVTSGCSLYTWDKELFFTLEIYTCSSIDINKILEFVQINFKTKNIVFKEVKHDKY